MENEVKLSKYSKSEYLSWKLWRDFFKSSKYREEIKSIEKTDVYFNMNGFKGLNPDGLLWILLVGERLVQQGNDLTLILPQDTEQLEYMETLGFFDLAKQFYFFSSFAEVESITSYRGSLGLGFRKVTEKNLGRIIGKSHAYLNSKEFTESITDSGIGDEVFEAVKPFESAYIEIIKNAVEHSQGANNSGVGYAVMAQSGSEKVNISVGDTGIGFLNSLVEKGVEVKKNTDAIREALLFTYQFSGKIKGEGLFEILGLAGRVGGKITIRSQDAEASLYMGDGRKFDRKELKKFIEDKLDTYHLATFPGVQFSLLLNKSYE